MDHSVEEMADALGVSPEHLKRVAGGLARVARSGPTVEEFTRQMREGYERTSGPASEALAAFQRS